MVHSKKALTEYALRIRDWTLDNQPDKNSEIDLIWLTGQLGGQFEDAYSWDVLLESTTKHEFKVFITPTPRNNRFLAVILGYYFICQSQGEYPGKMHVIRPSSHKYDLEFFRDILLSR